MIIMKTKLLIALAFCALLLCGCASKISEVKNEKYIGKTVTLTGTVENTIKIGSLSGYTLKDETGTIGVSSETLPKEGDKITVSGVLIKDTIFGYYVKVTE